MGDGPSCRTFISLVGLDGQQASVRKGLHGCKHDLAALAAMIERILRSAASGIRCAGRAPALDSSRLTCLVCGSHEHWRLIAELEWRFSRRVKNWRRRASAVIPDSMH